MCYYVSMKNLTAFIVVFIVLLIIVVFSSSKKSELPEHLYQSDSISDEVITSDNEVIMMPFSLTSPAFQDGSSIPSKYTCDGANVNPPLSIEGIPEGTVSLALIMDDPDIPQSVKDSLNRDDFVHWIVFNMPLDTKEISEDTLPPGIEGNSTRGEVGYVGSCPPDREHRYFFKLYALDIELDLQEGATKEEVESAMEAHIIEETQLIGLYERI